MATPRKRIRALDKVAPGPIVRPSLSRRSRLLSLMLQKDDCGCDEELQYADREVERNKITKLLGLLYVLGLDPQDPTSWFKLSLKLAEDYHPSFKVIGQSYRRRGGQAKNRSEKIYNEVNKRKAAGEKLDAAFRNIAKDPRFCGPSRSAEEIKSRYYEERRKQHRRPGGNRQLQQD